MRLFWPIYLLSAAVGTAGVYIAAPLARPFVAPLLPREQPAHAGGSKALGAQPQESGPSRAPVPPEAVEPDTPAAPEEPSLASPSGEVSPALNGVYLVQRGEKPGWGITRHRTTYYTCEGVRAGHVTGGVLLDFRTTRTSSRGAMVECLLRENDSPSAPLLVGAQDVFLFTGSYSNLSARQVSDLKGYYTLNGKITERKNELLQASAAKNPFFNVYSEAYKALMAHMDKAKELTAKRDHATELDRARLEDQLREMKVVETRLRNEYDAQLVKFRAWKKDHANELARPEYDPDVVKWSLEMVQLRKSVPGLAY